MTEHPGYQAFSNVKSCEVTVNHPVEASHGIQPVEQCPCSDKTCCISTLFIGALVIALSTFIPGCDDHMSCLTQIPSDGYISTSDYQATACRSTCHRSNTDIANYRNVHCDGYNDQGNSQWGLSLTVLTPDGPTSCRQPGPISFDCNDYNKVFKEQTHDSNGDIISMPILTYNAKRETCYLRTTAKRLRWNGIAWFSICLLILVCTLCCSEMNRRFCKNVLQNMANKL